METVKQNKSYFEMSVFCILLLAVAAVPLAFVPIGRPSYVKWLIIETVFPCLCAGWMVYHILGRRRPLRFSMVTVFAVAVFLAQILSFVNATNAHLVWVELVKTIGLFSAYFLVANLAMGTGRQTSLILALCIPGAVAGAYGVAQHFGWDFFQWEKSLLTPTTRGVSTFGHPNFAAHFLITVIPLTVCLLVAVRSKLIKALVAVCMVPMLWHLSITGSRGAALGLAAAACMVVILLFVDRRGRDGSDTGRLRTRRNIAVAAILLAVAVSAVVAAWKVKQSDPLSVREGQSMFRLRTWGTGIRLFLDHPAFGSGAGNYEVASPAYWDDVEQKNFMVNNRMSYRVHNEYIQTAAEQGIPGILAFIGLLAMGISEALQLVGSSNRRQRIYGLGFLAVIVAISVDSIFNFDFQTPASVLVFWVTLGMISVNVNDMKTT